MPTSTSRPFAPLLACALLAACGSSTSPGSAPETPPAAIVLSLSTDLNAPVDYDVLQIDVKQGTIDAFYQSYAVPADAKLPATLVLATVDDDTAGTLKPGGVKVASPGKPLAITVSLVKIGTKVVSYEADVTMPADRRKLDAKLAGSCSGVACDVGQTCTATSAGACVSAAVDATKLPGG